MRSSTRLGGAPPTSAARAPHGTPPFPATRVSQSGSAPDLIARRSPSAAPPRVRSRLVTNVGHLRQPRCRLMAASPGAVTSSSGSEMRAVRRRQVQSDAGSSARCSNTVLAEARGWCGRDLAWGHQGDLVLDGAGTAADKYEHFTARPSTTAARRRWRPPATGRSATPSDRTKP
jgi:hypothetical protein